jgi:hypothetical protein
MKSTQKRNADKRKSSRVRVASAASVRVKNREFDSLTRDVSPNGIYLYSDANITQGSTIEIVAMLPLEIAPQSAGTWVCCHARVVRVEDDAQTGRGIAAVIEKFGVVPEA